MNKKELYIIFGPPGSGKTTQSKYIAKILKFENISWGEIYRDVNKRNKYKKEFDIIKCDATSEEERSKKITNIIDSEISNFSNNFTGIIIDGYPRKKEEAKLLKRLIKKYNLELKSLIRINPSIKKAFERFNNRFTCPTCLKYYDTELNPPYTKDKCDIDNSDLKVKKQSRKKIEKDFYEYLKESKPAYESLKKISETSFDVSGEDDDIVIFSNILLKIKQKEKDNCQTYDRKTSARIETEHGTFVIHVYQSRLDYSYHLALVKNKVKGERNVLVRVHSSCITGEIFDSKKCECGEQLHEAMDRINKNGRGILIYLFQEGRGINILNKIKTYHLQNKGLDTIEANEKLGFPAELREYLPVRDILKDLGTKTINLMTNNPDKVRKLTDLGVVINDTIPIEIDSSKYNRKYLKTKKDKMNHSLNKI